MKPFCNNNKVMIDPILDTRGIKTTRKQVGVVSKWYGIYADSTKVIDVNQKKQWAQNWTLLYPTRNHLPLEFTSIICNILCSTTQVTLNQERAQPLIPWWYNLSNRISWSTVSKAFVKSRKTPTAYSPFSIACITLSTNESNAKWVDDFFCNILNISRKVETLLYIIFSKIFERKLKTETGLLLLNSMGSSLLYKEMTFAIFNWFGKIPWVRDKLQMLVSGLTRISEDILRDMEFMPSNPVAVSLNALINVSISFSVTGSRYIYSVKRFAMWLRGLLLTFGFDLANVAQY